VKLDGSFIESLAEKIHFSTFGQFGNASIVQVSLLTWDQPDGRNISPQFEGFR
jgi:hypothetical protein